MTKEHDAGMTSTVGVTGMAGGWQAVVETVYDSVYAYGAAPQPLSSIRDSMLIQDGDRGCR